MSATPGHPEAHVAYRGRTMKTVLIIGLGPNHDRDDAIALALDAAAETRSSLFLIECHLSTPTAVVYLHTDY